MSGSVAKLSLQYLFLSALEFSGLHLLASPFLEAAIAYLAILSLIP